MAYVYRHIRLDKNEPFYIGIGKNDNKGNFPRAKSKKDRNSIWNKIVNKSDYKIEIIFNDLSWEEACEKEKELILLYGKICNKTGILSNITDGGDGVVGVKSWNSGLIGVNFHSQETKDKISKHRKNKKYSEEVRLKQKEAGKKISQERRMQMSNIAKTRLRTDLEEYKKSYKKSTKIIDNTNYICFIGTKAAADYYNEAHRTLRNIISGVKINHLNIVKLDENLNEIKIVYKGKKKKLKNKSNSVD